MDISPSWISAGGAIVGASGVLVTGILAIGRLMFASREETRRMADAMAQMDRDHAESVRDCRDECRNDLSQAVEARRKDQEAMNTLIRADLNEKMQADVSRLHDAIRESKSERQAENKALRDDIREIKQIILRPRTGETTAVRRDAV